METSALEKYRNASDEKLLQLVSRKDLLAYETLYERHAQTVFNLLMRGCGLALPDRAQQSARPTAA